MGRISDLAANQLLDVMFGQVANPFAATYYLALSTTPPLDDGSGITEPAVGDYDRAPFDNDGVTFPGAADRSTTIAVDIVFPTASAGWGDISHFAVFDDPSAGNFLGWGALPDTIPVLTGATPTWVSGSLVITFPGT